MISTVVVDLPEWGGQVAVKSLSGLELEQLRLDKHMRTAMVVKCVVDEKGDRIFSDDDADGINQLSASPIGRIAKIVMDLSGLSAKSRSRIKKKFDDNPHLIMWYRLAIKFQTTVEALQRSLSAEEFAHWTEYYAREPWGCEADDYRMARLCAQIAASVGERTRVEQHYPPWRKKPEQSAAQMKQTLMATAGA